MSLGVTRGSGPGVLGKDLRPRGSSPGASGGSGSRGTWPTLILRVGVFCAESALFMTSKDVRSVGADVAIRMPDTSVQPTHDIEVTAASVSESPFQ